MPFLGRRHARSRPGPAGGEPGSDVKTGIPGLAAAASSWGWQPEPGPPFDGRLTGDVHEITRCMYGVPRILITEDRTVGDTKFRDVFRGSIDGRTVVVANAWTYIEPLLFGNPPDLGCAAVVATELPSILPVTCVQPRRFDNIAHFRESPVGNPAFDEGYRVTAIPSIPSVPMPGADQVLTPDVQQRIMAHDDWVFRAERYLFSCVSRGPFRSAEEVSQRIGEVMGIVAAIPASVMPARIDHSTDDLVARISRIDSIEDAMAFLQQLTPAEREQLARSDTPLAAMADVRTPEEAMARFQSMDPQRRMQLLAMFMRVEDGQH